MQVRLTHDAPGHVRTGALVVPFFSDNSLEGVAKEIDAKLGGIIADALAAKEIHGRLGEHVLVYAKDEPYRRVLAISLGERSRFEPHFLARYAGSAVRYLGRRNVEQIAIALPIQAQGQEAACASFVSEGAVTGVFETTLYQEKPDRRNATNEVTIIAGDLDEAELERGIARGTALGDAVNLARRLAITPANLMTPTRLAEEAAKVAEQNGLEIDVLDEARASREGMGSFLSVAQGSAQPPEVHRDALHGRSVEQRAARTRRQGNHVRHGRHFDQTRRAHGGHEVRHVRWRRRDCGDVRHRRN